MGTRVGEGVVLFVIIPFVLLPFVITWPEAGSVRRDVSMKAPPITNDFFIEEQGCAMYCRKLVPLLELVKGLTERPNAGDSEASLISGHGGLSAPGLAVRAEIDASIILITFVD